MIESKPAPSRNRPPTLPGTGAFLAHPMRLEGHLFYYLFDGLGGRMDKGNDFLKAQVNNAVALHNEFVKALENHEDQTEDMRFRDLCARHIPKMREHQRMLEEYQKEIDAGPGTFKKVVGATMGAARDLADSTRESDFLRLVNDIVMSRQCEDTFKTFREAGRQLGMTRLAQIGDVGESDHDDYNRDANRLVQQLFVEQVRGETQVGRERTKGSETSTQSRL